MAKVKIQGHASGTGALTVTAPNTSTDRTITLPDSTGTLLDENSSLPSANLTGTIADARLPDPLPAIDGSSLTGLPSTLNVGVIQGTVDTSTTGSQSFTGLSFTPKGYWVMYGFSSGQRKFGLGFTDGTTQSFLSHDATSADKFEGPSPTIVARVKHTANSNTHSLTHSSFNSNGVTVTKNRTGSITGTANVHFLCWG